MKKIAVCVPPVRCDVYGHLTRYATQLAETGAGRGVPVEILHFDAPDFLARLFTRLQDDEAVVHFHAYLYDLKVTASEALTRKQHVLQNAKATVLATISDHPFTDFMQDMIRGAHPHTTFITLDRSFPDEMRAMNPALAGARFDYQPGGPPQNYDPAQRIPFAARAFDLVVPVHIVDVGAGLGGLLSKITATWLNEVITATFEITVADISQNPFHTFMEHMRAVLGASFEDIRDHRPDVAGAILNALSTVDGLIRQERRHRMVRSLLKSVGKLKVAVLGDHVPALAADDNVQYLGMQQTPEAIALMANARAVLNCNPTYPTNLHERVTVGMMYGACVITDINPYLAQTFTRDEMLPYIPGSALTIADLFATHDVAAIGAAAASRVHGDRAFSWEGHFDELVRVVSEARGGAPIRAPEPRRTPTLDGRPVSASRDAVKAAAKAAAAKQAPLVQSPASQAM